MSDIAIRVDNLSKQYRIGRRRTYKTIRETIEGLFRPASGATRSTDQSFWALKDVNFEIKQGEVVGIIGRNGAGKSTLLKILSRITEPTMGQVETTGRLGSLLEVGTGFHPELTGRENVFLNGAILGMKKSDISKRFDQIVAFAEVERFLDTQVKHYSSGMYMRLAFAVAAHLEPEILIVDEVLAVGDAGFQRKCLGKMQDVSASGRTVLFVSHNMAAITALCQSCILLKAGSVAAQGAAGEVAAKYHAELTSQDSGDGDLRAATRTGSGQARFTTIRAASADPKTGQPTEGAIRTGGDILITADVQAGPHGVALANVAAILYEAGGFRLIDVNTALCGQFLELEAGARAQVRFHLRNLLLRPGTYMLGLWLGRANIEDIDAIETAATFTVVPEVGPATHTETFPGPYQCRFTTSISPA